MKNKKNRCYKDENSDIKKEEIMCKRILTIFLAVAGITIIGLGVINEAKAGTTINVKEVCENITFDVVGPVKNEGGGFDYTYTLVSGQVDVANLSYISLGFDRSVTITTADLELGDGNSDGWLYGVPLKTLEILPQEILGNKFTINATGEEKGEVFAYIKAGRNIESCVIEGPGVPPPCPGLPIDVTVPLTKIVALNNNSGGIFEYCIDIDPRTGCPFPESVPYECELDEEGERVYLDPDEDFVLGSSQANGDDIGPTTPTMIMGEGMDPRCPIAKAAHNPCQWIILTGKVYGPVCW